MLRSIVLVLCLMLFGAFVAGDPIAGKWGTCGAVKVGDPKLELSRRYMIPCPDQNHTWTDITFDTINGGRATICTSSCGNIPPGVPCFAAGGACHYGKWSYDKSASTLMIKDSTTVYYLVSSITDSSMVLIRK
jgi:hypothetical protein